MVITGGRARCSAKKNEMPDCHSAKEECMVHVRGTFAFQVWLYLWVQGTLFPLRRLKLPPGGHGYITRLSLQSGRSVNVLNCPSQDLI